MKLFYDASYYLSCPSGIGVYTVSLLNALLKLEPSLEVGCGMTSLSPATHRRLAEAIAHYSPGLGIQQHRRYLPKTFYNFPDFITRPFRFSRSNWDLVHFTGFVCPEWIPFDSIDRCILTIHDMFVFHEQGKLTNPSFQYIRDNLQKQATKAAAVIVNSEYTKREVLHYLPDLAPDRIFITPLAVQNGKFDCVPGNDFLLRNHLNRFFLSVGPLSSKNHDKLIRAFLKFQKTPEYHKGDALVIAGHYYEAARELRELVRNSPGIFFFEDIASKDLILLYKNALGFFLMSDNEGFGIPLLEAMTAGCPACCHPGSAVDELGRGKLFTADPDVEQSMIDQFARFSSGDSRIAESVAEGKKIASEYSWERTAALTLDVYRKVAGI